MYKKIILLLIFLIVLVVVFFFVTKEKKNIQVNPNQSNYSNQDQRKMLSENRLIDDVFMSAKAGKVPHVSFITGVTKIKDIKKIWGDSEQTSNVDGVTYDIYSNYDITIGYQNEFVFDLRSYHSDLQAIHYDTIKNLTGEPDNVRYYQDKEVDQIILIYNVGESEQLKWVLPKPTKKEPNPVVHHISVVSNLKNKDDQQQIIKVEIANMSLEEKIGQMMMVGISDHTVIPETEKLIVEHKVGGIIFYSENLENPKQTVELLNQIKTINRTNKYPLLLGIDQEGGRISRLPGKITGLPTNETIGSINQPQFSYEIGQLLGKQLNAFGFNLDFAPVLDINNNPDNPVINDRSFGSDSSIVSELGVITMKGIQSQNIMSVIKHFPGHGDTAVDSHLELPVINKNLEDITQLELIPFKDAIDQGADIVMVAHILLPEIDTTYPSSMSKRVIKDILKEQLHFNGVVITDDMTMKAITNEYDIGQASVQSVKAGSDIILIAHEYNNILTVISDMVDAVGRGEISEERIDDSVKKIIELKRKYAVNNDSASYVNIDEINQLTKQLLHKFP